MNKKDATKKIEELREDMGNLTNMEVYDCVWSLIRELEEAGVYCDGVLNDIITEEEAEAEARYHIETCGLQGLRCYLGDTCSDELYRLDGYANLANISDSDWGYILDDMVWRVNDSDLDDDLNDDDLDDDTDMLRGDADDAI